MQAGEDKGKDEHGDEWGKIDPERLYSVITVYREILFCECWEPQTVLVRKVILFCCSYMKL